MPSSKTARLVSAALLVTATLAGAVDSWMQRDAAERAAASAPGVVYVDNQLEVRPFHAAHMDEWDDAWI